MRPRIVIRPRARSDLREQANYLGRSNRDVGHRYLNNANQAFEELARMPGLGSPQEFDNPDLAGLRCWRVPGFEKHLIYYLTREDGIKIVRVLHGARDVRSILEAEDVE